MEAAMAEELYLRLREQMDQYSFGFPATESGVELELLKKLFNESEARMYLGLSMQPETAEMVAQRLSADPVVVIALLELMFQKGLVFRMPVEGVLHYMAAPFMIGIYENQVHTMDREFAELIERYFKEAFFDQFAELPLRLTRILPINKSLDTTHRVSTFEEASDYISTQNRFAIADCACKTQQGKIDNPCYKPVEVCMAFGWYADYLVDAKVGRRITGEEALKIQKQCDDAGLVTLSGNVTDPIVFCHCCSCCCLGLRSFLTRKRPADHTCSNYFAEVDPDSCEGCEACVERCPMGAAGMGPDNAAVVSRARCIGCGICVTGCDFEAIKLQLKPEEERTCELVSSRELAAELAHARQCG